MRYKSLFHFTAIAALACSVVLAIFLTVGALRQLMSLAGDYADSISRILF